MQFSRVAIFGAGCFWGVEKAFKKKFGPLIETKVGYCGGTTQNPSYQQVCSGTTGHAECVQISYDPIKLDYKELVDFFYRSHEPFTKNRQGNDCGTQYRSAIFTTCDEQRETAETMTKLAQTFYGKRTITTEISPAGQFYLAEDYHQDYLAKHPHGYECATHFERSWDAIKRESIQALGS